MCLHWVVVFTDVPWYWSIYRTCFWHIVGEQEIPGLTDTTVPRRLGPKRASKIRKLFNLKKDDDVRQYVVRRPLPAKEGSLHYALLGKQTHLPSKN